MYKELSCFPLGEILSYFDVENIFPAQKFRYLEYLSGNRLNIDRKFLKQKLDKVKAFHS